jgi:hypothetical protein
LRADLKGAEANHQFGARFQHCGSPEAERYYRFRKKMRNSRHLPQEATDSYRLSGSLHDGSFGLHGVGVYLFTAGQAGSQLAAPLQVGGTATVWLKGTGLWELRGMRGLPGSRLHCV